MLNVQNNSEYMEEVEKIKNIEVELQNQTEFNCWDYNINYFGVGRGAEE
jgi:hypothetical protein